MQKNTFKKEERLCKKILIDSLFSGDGVTKHKEFPFILLSKEIDDDDELSTVPVKVMFSVSKRRIKLAVKRNLIKRKMREAYRLNKHDLISTLTKENKKLITCFIYLDKKPLPYNYIEQKIIVLLNRLNNESE